MFIIGVRVVDRVSLGLGILARNLSNPSWLRPHAFAIKNQAQNNLVVGGHIVTGDLHGSIHVESNGYGDGYDVVAGEGESPITADDRENLTAFYASWGEYGTRNMRAWPYMEPAMRNQIPKIIEGVTDIHPLRDLMAR